MWILVVLLPYESEKQWEVGGYVWNCILLSEKRNSQEKNYGGKF
jgi:hypothetical protein